MAREIVELRKPYNKTFLLDNGHRWFVTVLSTQLHLADKTPVDCAVRASAGVWTVGRNAWDYALGRPDDKPEDGWTSFGVGNNRIRFRLLGIGYLHWPTRTWQPIVGAPTYDRAKLRSINRPLILGPQGAEVELYPVGLTEWTGFWSIAGDNVWMRQRVEGRILKEEVGLSQRARAWIGQNARPTTPANETFLSLLYELDPHEVYRWYQVGRVLDINSGFDDLAGAIELRTAANNLLAQMPQSTAHVDVGGLGMARINLRKRIWRDPVSGRFFLALGARVDELAQLPEGELVFDPTYSSQVATADTLVRAGAPDTEYGGDLALGVWDSGEGPSLLTFDLSGIPASPTVTDGALTLWTGAYSWDGLTDVFAHRILAANSAWIENCTWNYAVPSTTRWAGDTGSDGGADAGCSVADTDYHATDMFTGNLSGVENTQNDLADADAAARTEIENMIAANHGMIVWKKAAQSGHYAYLRSAEYATAGERPLLMIEYTVAAAGNPWYYYAQMQ